MAPLPSVSIVTPSFNHARFIDATIQSVLSQNYAGLEYIVVDGASTDGTVEILRRYDGRLHWISEPDAGQSDALNKGYARTAGEILGWLNSDDTYADGAVEAAAKYLAENPNVGVVYGDADFIDEDGRPLRPCAQVEPFDFDRLLHNSNFVVQPAAFFRRDVLQAVGGIDTSLHWTMDYDLWLKAARKTRIVYLPRLLAHYRWVTSSKTNVGGWQRLAEVEAVARRHGARGLPAAFRLEAARLNLTEAAQAARYGKLHVAAGRVCGAVGNVLGSPRTLASLLDGRTWRCLRASQVRRRAGALD